VHATVAQLRERHGKDQATRLLLLTAPDEQIREKLRAFDESLTTEQEEKFLAYVRQQRERDPDFLEPMGPSNPVQYHLMSAGGFLQSAQFAAEHTGSYLFTDLLARWEVLKRSKETLTKESKVWTPFAKSLQEARFSFLNDLNLGVALRLRQEGRLSGVRGVLREAWNADLTDDEFDEQNAVHLSENLKEKVREAEAEWLDIKAELAKYAGAELAAGLLAGGPLVASGHAWWLAGGAIVAGAAHSAISLYKSKGFKKRFPASFFIDLESTD
jgi:hypothetical protein